MKKVIQDVQCLPEIALAWAISAKTLQNHQAFYDYEDGILMFERTEDDVDEETNNNDGNTAQSENDLNKGVDNEDGVLSAEDTGNAEGTIAK